MLILHFRSARGALGGIWYEDVTTITKATNLKQKVQKEPSQAEGFPILVRV